MVQEISAHKLATKEILQSSSGQKMNINTAKNELLHVLTQLRDLLHALDECKDRINHCYKKIDQIIFDSNGEL